MSANISLVASFTDHRVAESVLTELRHAGFDPSKLAIVGRAFSEDSANIGAVPGVNGLDALDEVQYACIPQESIGDYEAELESDRFLLVAHGAPQEIAEAKRVIDRKHPESWDGKVGCAVYYGCRD